MIVFVKRNAYELLSELTLEIYLMPALDIHIEKQVDTRKVKDRDYCYE